MKSTDPIHKQTEVGTARYKYSQPFKTNPNLDLLKATKNHNTVLPSVSSCLVSSY